ncbi:cobaltochelatase CobT [Amycolatopsis lurida]|uniref:Cobalt chelatase n=1 Tax=Amycolatopsis lurida NRRL 2430 TaxID=1460371 RepID=A0A2P2FPU8_AMYLU|nr:cobalt chelatase [Amycolatopsis lurida]KFU78754.1 cobalt chelatase [Amycolatopsis lurida NRRL 2430]SEB31898.1 cobaltochelatase CobT [Amycolatopsis lurida]
MTTAQAETRRRNQVEELCAAAIRALSGDPALHFRARRLHRGREPLPLHAPHLRPSADDDLLSSRGIADGMALRLTASDAALHRTLCPRDPAERGIFELLEQFRVESLPPAELPGMRRNLRLRHLRWSLEFHRSGLTETARGLLLYTVAQICRSRITGEPVVEETEDLIEATRFALAPSLGHDLAGLRRHRTDQKAFAEHALAIARTTGALLTGTEQDAEDGSDPADPTDPRFSLVIDFDASLGEQIPAATAGTSRTLGESGATYRVFTTAYDRERRASDLVRPGLLAELRERLDRRVARQGVGAGRLARDLQAVLAEPARDGWDAGQEEGHLDGRTLAQLISSPTERRIFRTERIEPVADTLVTFLLDCSGSMTAHAEPVAALVDLLTRSIELAGASCEVLGFTTGAWNGGGPGREWRRAGRPRHPGRLNERLHLVFKDAETPWRRARPDLAALLKADLFREGIDGEAVAWACERMRARTAARRILLVLSDGSPMDGATSLANDPHYLDEHLRETVLREENTVEIRGVGVGLDLSPFYRRSRVLDTSVTSGYAPFRDVLGLLTLR